MALATSNTAQPIQRHNKGHPQSILCNAVLQEQFSFMSTALLTVQLSEADNTGWKYKPTTPQPELLPSFCFSLYLLLTCCACLSLIQQADRERF